MQIVIDIKDDDYYDIIGDTPYIFIGEYTMREIINAVKNDTPLPKGHGRLIDADAFGKELHRYTEAPYQYALKVFNDAPIIIEADRSGKE